MSVGTETEEIATALEGHRLDTQPPARGHCQRCMQKNRKRLHAGVGDRDRTLLVDGEEVALLATLADGWQVRDLIHADHSPPPFDELAAEGLLQAYAAANVDLEPGGLTLRNVAIERVSSVDEGESVPPMSKKLKQLGARGWTVPLDLEEPHPLWPEAEREWLAELLADPPAAAEGGART